MMDLVPKEPKDGTRSNLIKLGYKLLVLTLSVMKHPGSQYLR